MEEKENASCWRKLGGRNASDGIKIFLEHAESRRNNLFDAKPLEEKVEIIFDLLILLIKIDWITYKTEVGIESTQMYLLKAGLEELFKKYNIQ